MVSQPFAQAQRLTYTQFVLTCLVLLELLTHACQCRLGVCRHVYEYARMLIQSIIDTGILTTHVKASHGGTAQTYAADMVKEIKVRFPVLNLNFRKFC